MYLKKLKRDHDLFYIRSSRDQMFNNQTWLSAFSSTKKKQLESNVFNRNLMQKKNIFFKQLLKNIFDFTMINEESVKNNQFE